MGMSIAMSCPCVLSSVVKALRSVGDLGSALCACNAQFSLSGQPTDEQIPCRWDLTKVHSVNVVGGASLKVNSLRWGEQSVSKNTRSGKEEAQQKATHRTSGTGKACLCSVWRERGSMHIDTFRVKKI
jgi:hypothetical protein